MSAKINNFKFPILNFNFCRCFNHKSVGKSISNFISEILTFINSFVPKVLGKVLEKWSNKIIFTVALQFKEQQKKTFCRLGGIILAAKVKNQFLATNICRCFKSVVKRPKMYQQKLIHF